MHTFQPPFVLEPMFLAVNSQMSADGERENVGAEAAHVIAHAHQVPETRRRVTVRRLVARDDDPFLRVSTDAGPLASAVNEQAYQSGERDDDTAIVAEET